MKDKKWVYLLLPVVVVVWGLIIYRLLNAVVPPDDILPPATPALASPVAFVVADSVVLRLDYRDPFLGNAPAHPREPGGASFPREPRFSRPATPTTPAILPAPTPLTWPAVQYAGMIQNGTSRIKIALLKMSGKTHLLSEGQTAGDVTVYTITPDSVGLTYRGAKRYVKK